MPKQTFYNLPEDKRQTLIHAAKLEFTRVPLYEASVSNIVKSAGIPRGSFYQYFADKEDAFFYLLDEHAAKRQEKFTFILKECKGDLFVAIAEMYESMLRALPNQEDRDFYKNAFLNMTHKIENTFSVIFNDTGNSDQNRKVNQLIDKAKLNISNEQDLVHVMKIITAVTFRNFIEKFANELSLEEAIKNFTIEMNLLKSGLCKKHVAN